MKYKENFTYVHLESKASGVSLIILFCYSNNIIIFLPCRFAHFKCSSLTLESKFLYLLSNIQYLHSDFISKHLFLLASFTFTRHSQRIMCLSCHRMHSTERMHPNLTQGTRYTPQYIKTLILSCQKGIWQAPNSMSFQTTLATLLLHNLPMAHYFYVLKKKNLIFGKTSLLTINPRCRGNSVFLFKLYSIFIPLFVYILLPFPFFFLFLFLNGLKLN